MSEVIIIIIKTKSSAFSLIFYVGRMSIGECAKCPTGDCVVFRARDNPTMCGCGHPDYQHREKVSSTPVGHVATPASSPAININLNNDFGNMVSGHFGASVNSAAAAVNENQEKREERKKAVSSGKGYEIATVGADPTSLSRKPKNPKIGTNEPSSNDRFIEVTKKFLDIYGNRVPTLANKDESWELSNMNVQARANSVWKHFCTKNDITANASGTSRNQRSERDNKLIELIGEVGDDAKLQSTVHTGTI